MTYNILQILTKFILLEQDPMGATIGFALDGNLVKSGEIAL